MSKVTALFFTFLLLILFAFQNCGELKSAGSSSTLTANSGGDPLTDQPPTENDPVVIPPSPPQDTPFESGQVVNPSRLNFNASNQEFAAQLAGYDVLSANFKAIAINEDGDGLASTVGNQMVSDQAEWNRVVQERCQLLYQKPCALVASGATFSLNEVDLPHSVLSLIAS